MSAKYEFRWTFLPADGTLPDLSLAFLEDRDRISLSQAKSLVMDAVAAWVGIEALLDERDVMSARQRERLVREALGRLEARLAYCREISRSLLSSPPVREDVRVAPAPVPRGERLESETGRAPAEESQPSGFAQLFKPEPEEFEREGGV